MKYVYILRSEKDSSHHYTGITDDLDTRLREHNSLSCVHTKKYSPWKVIVSVAFEDNKKAFEFERYLKSGSGRAFAKKHF
jgi:predicted GIY-YIG superfamily endonuclease